MIRLHNLAKVKRFYRYNEGPKSDDLGLIKREIILDGPDQ